MAARRESVTGDDTRLLPNGPTGLVSGGHRAAAYAACAIAVLFSVRVWSQYSNGVPWVAANVYGLSEAQMSAAAACGRGFVGVRPTCQERSAPVASWLANAGAINAHGPPAIIALLIGVHNLQAKRGTRRHVWLGRAYALAVAISAPFALVLAAHTTLGLVGAAGFALLALLWAGATALGVVSLLPRFQRDGVASVERHRRWMVRSYALTFSAVTVRLSGWLLHQLFPASFSAHYVIGAWLGWVPNLLAAEAYLRRFPLKGPY
ncbi:hypothetical protein KFE25_008066 [Diacronema lutheri]|uniref:DUF2306 domain-containing protein n=2 Tax=Diacronema lutheri TaxID=2081491 RepID=A0A8J6C9M9_DIALT|nr:hypothetical protein KFE25_008066 [Diacronema lutheri]